MKNYLKIIALGFMILSCVANNKESDSGEIKLIVLAPGHFHANLLQKQSMSQVSDSVYVYAPSSDPGLNQYLKAIESFNNRSDNPTQWVESVYTGDDFQQKMIADKKGNVVVLAGNNKDKTKYIRSAINAGLNVLSDKPMAINQDDFHQLVEAYAEADKQKVSLYDMMTERYDIMNLIEKELMQSQDLFGELTQGTPEEPAIFMESVHHFYKEVSGAPLIRPAWYYDTAQQGEGIADVTTHLIDQLFWKCFPGESIDYTSDISEINSTHWPTEITLSEFTKSTGETVFPDYLEKYIENSILKVYANGTVNFNVKNLNVGLNVIWNYQAPEGSGDTFMSVIKGTKATLKTIQDKDHNFVKQLYIKKNEDVDSHEFSSNLQQTIDKIKVSYPFISTSSTENNDEYIIQIPVSDRSGHESHFTQVAESFFGFLGNQDMPEWEKNNTLAKYYITTKAVAVAEKRD